MSGTAHAVSAQLASAGGSEAAIHEAVLSVARPSPSLSWLDLGCGTGDLLRLIRARHEPARLVGVDLIDWLDPDLRPAVETHIGPAEAIVGELDSFDRVLMVETIEHLQAPWTVLERAGGRVAPGGRIVVSTPNLATLRHRLELLVRGQLTSFRPGNAPHLTPALPHVISATLRESGLSVERERFAAADVIPLTGGTKWPRPVTSRAGRLTSVSVIVAGERPR